MAATTSKVLFKDINKVDQASIEYDQTSSAILFKDLTTSSTNPASSSSNWTFTTASIQDDPSVQQNNTINLRGSQAHQLTFSYDATQNKYRIYNQDSSNTTALDLGPTSNIQLNATQTIFGSNVTTRFDGASSHVGSVAFLDDAIFNQGLEVATGLTSIGMDGLSATGPATFNGPVYLNQSTVLAPPSSTSGSLVPGKLVIAADTQGTLNYADVALNAIQLKSVYAPAASKLLYCDTVTDFANPTTSQLPLSPLFGSIRRLYVYYYDTTIQQVRRSIYKVNLNFTTGNQTADYVLESGLPIGLCIVKASSFVQYQWNPSCLPTTSIAMISWYEQAPLQVIPNASNASIPFFQSNQLCQLYAVGNNPGFTTIFGEAITRIQIVTTDSQPNTTSVRLQKPEEPGTVYIINSSNQTLGTSLLSDAEANQQGLFNLVDQGDATFLLQYGTVSVPIVIISFVGAFSS